MAAQFAGAASAAVMVGGAVMNIATGVQRWATYRDTVAALRDLPQGVRNDIGIDAAYEDYAESITDAKRG